MAKVKISDLDDAATLDGTELVELEQDGGSVQGTTANIARCLYKRYVALLSQSGTDAPVATVLENTFGGAIVWTRNDAGDYTGTLSGAFPAGKTWFSANAEYESENIWLGNMRRVSNNEIGLYANTPTPNTEDGFTNMSIEIRVYP